MKEIKTIYLNPLAINALNEIRGRSPNFNFSNWVSIKLIREVNKDQSEPLEEIDMKLKEINIEIDKLRQERDLYEERLIKAKTKKEEGEEEEKERKKTAEEYKKRMLQSYKDSFFELFEVTEEEAEALANEYHKVRATHSIFDLGREKKLKEKEL